MAQKTALLVAVLLLQQACLPSGLRFTTFLDMTVPAAIVASEAVVRKPCECRERCWWDPSCTGVTLLPEDGSHLHTCLFTDRTVAVPNYEGLLTQLHGATSFVKKMACLEGFTDVPEVGCMFFGSAETTYAEAKDACPAGSGLFSPSSAATFRSMQDYLFQRLPDVPHNFWIGVERRPDGATWQWRQGGYMGQSASLVYWEAPEPNQNFDCARMAYTPGYTHFTLADFPCENNYTILCEQF